MDAKIRAAWYRTFCRQELKSALLDLEIYDPRFDSREMIRHPWEMNEAALQETGRILRGPGHPEFPRRMTALLSRCDKPAEPFSLISRERFLES